MILTIGRKRGNTLILKGFFIFLFLGLSFLTSPRVSKGLSVSAACTCTGGNSWACNNCSGGSGSCGSCDNDGWAWYGGIGCYGRMCKCDCHNSGATTCSYSCAPCGNDCTCLPEVTPTPTPHDTPTHTPTSTPTLKCSALEATEGFTTTGLEVGDRLSLTCKDGSDESWGPDSAEIRHKIDGGSWHYMGLVPTLDPVWDHVKEEWIAVSYEKYFDTPGSYTAQCRFCKGGNCTPWAPPCEVSFGVYLLVEEEEPRCLDLEADPTSLPPEGGTVDLTAVAMVGGGVGGSTAIRANGPSSGSGKARVITSPWPDIEDGAQYRVSIWTSGVGAVVAAHEWCLYFDDPDCHTFVTSYPFIILGNWAEREHLFTAANCVSKIQETAASNPDCNYTGGTIKHQLPIYIDVSAGMSGRIDNVSLRRDGTGPNLITNGDFESGVTGWKFRGEGSKVLVTGGGPLEYLWGSNGGSFGQANPTIIDMNTWTLPANTSDLGILCDAWVTVSDDNSSSGGQGTNCSVSVGVAAEKELPFCDHIAVTDESGEPVDLDNFPPEGGTLKLDVQYQLGGYDPGNVWTGTQSGAMYVANPGSSTWTEVPGAPAGWWFMGQSGAASSMDPVYWEVPPAAGGFEGSDSHYAYVLIGSEELEDWVSGCAWSFDDQTYICTDDGSLCVVEVTQGENDLNCDDITVNPAEPQVEDLVDFTCTGSTAYPYPATPYFDFRVYFDDNEDGLFDVGNMENCDGECVASGDDTSPVDNGDGSWTGTFDSGIYVNYGYYGVSCRICIGGGGLSICTPFAVPSSRCIPSCTDRECGDDGCGGSCGTCDVGDVCHENVWESHCCTPYCDPAWECGLDGCGRLSCGTCDPGEMCDENGQCVPEPTGTPPF